MARFAYPSRPGEDAAPQDELGAGVQVLRIELFPTTELVLDAKMARSDGVVTRDEVAAFHRIVTVPPEQQARIEMLFDLAKQTSAGFEAYAGQIAESFRDEPALLEDVLDGLFLIAAADGAIHQDEHAYLRDVATIFGIDDTNFARIEARHVRRADDPYLVQSYSLANVGPCGGLNCGIDFKGGTLLEVQAKSGTADIPAMRTTLGSLGLGEIQIQQFGGPADVLIRVAEQPGGDAAQQAAVQKLRAAFGDTVEYRRVEVVGPRVSSELLAFGMLGLMLAIFGILIYLWFRFEWQFALGAMIANVHDIVLTIGFMSVSQVEFDLTSIAALLTILGYSLNDTVIFYNPKKKMAVEATRYPGILRQIEKGNVFLTEIPASLQKLKKNDLLLSSFFWEQARAETVLLFGGNSVLCANSPLNISYFMSKGLQYVGSPWHNLKGVGGAGDLSLRNRTLVLQTIRNLQKSGRQSIGNAVKEDAVIVRSLLESKVRVATQQDTHNFAMFDATAFGRPLGGVGTLGGLDDITRQKYVDYCPELKMMFPSLHGPACFGSDPDAIGCFRYLCNAGGLKCNKKNSSVSWIDQKMNKRVTIRIES
eukprot:gene23279-30171_t